MQEKKKRPRWTQRKRAVRGVFTYAAATETTWSVGRGGGAQVAAALLHAPRHSRRQQHTATASGSRAACIALLPRASRQRRACADVIRPLRARGTAITERRATHAAGGRAGGRGAAGQRRARGAPHHCAASTANRHGNAPDRERQQGQEKIAGSGQPVAHPWRPRREHGVIHRSASATRPSTEQLGPWLLSRSRASPNAHTRGCGAGHHATSRRHPSCCLPRIVRDIRAGDGGA